MTTPGTHPSRSQAVEHLADARIVLRAGVAFRDGHCAAQTVYVCREYLVLRSEASARRWLDEVLMRLATELRPHREAHMAVMASRGVLLARGLGGATEIAAALDEVAGLIAGGGL